MDSQSENGIFGSGEVINLSGNKHEKDEKHFRTCPNLNLDRFEIISILRLKIDHFRQKTINHFAAHKGLVVGLLVGLKKTFGLELNVLGYIDVGDGC